MNGNTTTYRCALMVVIASLVIAVTAIADDTDFILSKLSVADDLQELLPEDLNGLTRLTATKISAGTAAL